MHKRISHIFTFISNFKKEEILSLDKNIGIIFRNYEKNLDIDNILKLKNFCKIHNRKLFLSNNLKMAAKLNLDGAYIPSFNRDLGIIKFNLKKNFLILGSAHNIFEIKIKEKQGVDMIFLSPLFNTKDKNGLGIIKFNILSKMSVKKIIALGGINKKNLNKIGFINCSGFCAISHFQKS
tara:strand:- start:9942 stop:10478 length:537 start_codon:yes stop_codon:yes gene_type:complete